MEEKQISRKVNSIIDEANELLDESGYGSTIALDKYDVDGDVVTIYANSYYKGYEDELTPISLNVADLDDEDNEFAELLKEDAAFYEHGSDDADEYDDDGNIIDNDDDYDEDEEWY